MSAAETLLDWAPAASTVVIGRVSDAIDADLIDDLSAGLSDLADVAEDGVAVVAAAGEQAARGVVRIVRRRPVLAAFVAGVVLAGVLGVWAKRRRAADDQPPLHAAA